MRLYLNDLEYIETTEGIDLSMPINQGKQNANAWYCEPVKITPVINENFTGDTTKGGSVNFKGITINPHGNGTHTECVGHISIEPFTINQCLKEFHFLGRVISIQPKKIEHVKDATEDTIIDRDQIEQITQNWTGEKALIIRTLPNQSDKLRLDYSGTNPTYFTLEAMKYINELGVEHLMVDLPSVDRELDDGVLECHHEFWNYPNNTQAHKTISELLFVPDDLKDGRYFVHVQIMSIENDASPSKIMVHQIKKA